MDCNTVIAMHVDALITDLDGTFWSPTTEIHANSLATVATIEDRGLRFVIATGRRARGAHHALDRYGLGSRPAILMNGAIVRDSLDGDSIVVHDIDRPAALAIVDRFRESGLEPVVYIDHDENDMVIGESSAAGDAYLATTVGYERVGDISEAINASTVTGFGAFGFHYDLLKPINDSVNDQELAASVIGVSHIEGGHGIMIQAHGIHKQTGIDAWCRHSGIDVSRIAVVGDGHNDIEMLEAAKIAIVPDNAPPEIIELADVVIPPNEAGGWEQIPEILGLV